MNNIKRTIQKITFLGGILIILISCNSDDKPYEKLIDNTLVEYAGKIDSTQAYFGINKVKLRWKLSSDPAVKFLNISWNEEGKVEPNMLKIDVEDSDINNFMEAVIEDIPSGSYNFKVITHHDNKTKSIPVEILTKVLDQDFINTLRPNLVESAVYRDGVLDISWGGNSNASYVESEIFYTNTNDLASTKKVQSDELNTSIDGYKENTEITYFSRYYEAGMIDSLVSATAVVPVRFIYPQVEKDGWVITADPRVGDSRVPKNFIDGEINSEYVMNINGGNKYPHLYDIKFNKTLTIDGLELAQRYHYWWGTVTKFEILHSINNGLTWVSTKDVELAPAVKRRQTFTIKLDSQIEATDIRFIFKADHKGGRGTALGELNLFVDL